MESQLSQEQHVHCSQPELENETAQYSEFEVETVFPNEVIDRTDEVYPIIQTVIDEFISGCNQEPNYGVISKEIEITQVNDNEETSTNRDNQQIESDTILLDKKIEDSHNDNSCEVLHQLPSVQSQVKHSEIPNCSVNNEDQNSILHENMNIYKRKNAGQRKTNRSRDTKSTDQFSKTECLFLDSFDQNNAAKGSLHVNQITVFDFVKSPKRPTLCRTQRGTKQR